MTNICLALATMTNNQTLKITPHGTSMCPLFMGERDSIEVIAPDFPLMKGEIALFLREDETYVIHRICKVMSSNGQRVYYMVGDNQTEIEGPILESQIHAVTVAITRKGKYIDCKRNVLYRFYSFMWLSLLKFRPMLKKLEFKIRKISHKN